MKKFGLKLLLYCSLVCIFILVLVWVDLFGIVHRPFESIPLYINVNAVQKKLYVLNKNKDKYTYDSFILGSSKAYAFKCSDWKNHLSDTAIPFQFNSAGDGIFGIVRKLQYLEENAYQLNNVIVVLDENTLSATRNSNVHLFTAPPEISKESYWNYYITFIRAHLNPYFCLGLFQYFITGEITGNAKAYLRKAKKKRFNNFDLISMEHNSKRELKIKADSNLYYDKRLKDGEFYDRPALLQRKAIIDLQTLKILLSEMYGVFERNKTNYRIIISPSYDQRPLRKQLMSLLQESFSPSKIYNYSGVNSITNVIGNYYESRHYRPHVGKRIMNEMYLNPSPISD